MTDILFYDFDFNVIAAVPRVISLNFEKKYCGYGTAEVHVSLSEKNIVEMLEGNPYLFFAAGDNYAVVTGWRIDEDIAIFARTTEWLLKKRGVKIISQSSASPEVIALDAVMDAAGDFVQAGDIYQSGIVMDYSTDGMMIVYDVVYDVLHKSGLGFKLVPDIKNKKFVFSVYSGSEALCMFSPSSRTASDMTYSLDKLDMVTKSGWYQQKYTDKGGWNAISNSPALANNAAANQYKFYKITSASYSDDYGTEVRRFGLWCRNGYYIYCDTEDGQWKISSKKPSDFWKLVDNGGQSGAKRWDAVLTSAETKEAAVEALSKLRQQEETSLTAKGVDFGRDYNLGDVVRVQFELGKFKKSKKKRVTSVLIYYDVDESGIKPVLSSLEE